MDVPPISRGFSSRRREQGLADRIPPGQYVTTDFPVLSAGPTPQINLEEWTFALQLNGWVLGEWKWAEFQGLPQPSDSQKPRSSSSMNRNLRTHLALFQK